MSRPKPPPPSLPQVRYDVDFWETRGDYRYGYKDGIVVCQVRQLSLFRPYDYTNDEMEEDDVPTAYSD